MQVLSQMPPKRKQKKIKTKKRLQNAEKPHLGSITFTNTYINILHTPANQKESGYKFYTKDVFCRFFPHRRFG